jgi:hypothetical protein
LTIRQIQTYISTELQVACEKMSPRRFLLAFSRKENPSHASFSDPQKTIGPASPANLPKRARLPFPSGNIECLELVAKSEDHQALILEIAALSSHRCSSQEITAGNHGHRRRKMHQAEADKDRHGQFIHQNFKDKDRIWSQI